MEPEGSFLCFQESAAGSHPEPDEYSSNTPIILWYVDLLLGNNRETK
jgi:hypothetical protein